MDFIYAFPKDFLFFIPKKKNIFILSQKKKKKNIFILSQKKKKKKKLALKAVWQHNKRFVLFHKKIIFLK